VVFFVSYVSKLHSFFEFKARRSCW